MMGIQRQHPAVVSYLTDEEDVAAMPVSQPSTHLI